MLRAILLASLGVCLCFALAEAGNVLQPADDIPGPVWTTNDLDMFQDTFPLDGTRTGIGRADTAIPADAVIFICGDPLTAVPVTNPSGLADDAVLGGKQVYLYVHCSDPLKTGAMLTDTPASYPFKDTVVADGRTWTRIRCVQTAAPSGTQFRVDLNDALFDGGDVVEFFFGATNTNDETTYRSGSSLTETEDVLATAAHAASEFTILPRSGTGGILYVDGMDGLGAQQYWDATADTYNDRFDVRGPGDVASNHPSDHVVDVVNQLLAPYAAIVWDGGDLATPLTADDYAMLNAYLAAIDGGFTYERGGVYICGNDAAASLSASADASAIAFRTTYVPFTLTTGNHQPNYGETPFVQGSLNGPFFVCGECPLLNDFDVMTPTGSTVAAMTYGPPSINNGAVLTNATGKARVVLSGFSLVYIRDDVPDWDRALHYRAVLSYLAPFFFVPETGVPPLGTNELAQNYPNPFNPQTTIAFAIKERSHVRIDVFDVSGASVKTLVDETRAAGAYSDVRWDGRDAAGSAVASGVYFCKLTTKDFSQTRKMVLLK